MNWVQKKKLTEERGKLVNDMQALLKKANDETRDISGDEQKSFDEMHTRAESIKSQLDRYEQFEKLTMQTTETRQQPGRDDIGTEKTEADERAKEVRDEFQQYLRGANPMELRALSVGSVGVVGDRLFATSIVESLKSFAGVLEAGAEVIPTADGNERGIPSIDDTGNTGRQTAEAGSNTNETDPVLGAVTLKAYLQDSDWIRISMEYLRDASYPIEAKLIELATKRVGGKLNALTTTGSGVATVKGFVTAAAVGKTCAATNAVTYDELIDFEHSLDASYRYSKSCRIQLHDNTLAALRKLKDNSGAYIWASGTNGLLASIDGFGYVVNNDMAYIGSGAGSVIAAIGDWSSYKVRVVGQPEVIITKEKYIDTREVGYRIVQAFDGNLADAKAVKLLKLHA